MSDMDLFKNQGQLISSSERKSEVENLISPQCHGSSRFFSNFQDIVERKSLENSVSVQGSTDRRAESLVKVAGEESLQEMELEKRAIIASRIKESCDSPSRHSIASGRNHKSKTVRTSRYGMQTFTSATGFASPQASARKSRVVPMMKMHTLIEESDRNPLSISSKSVYNAMRFGNRINCYSTQNIGQIGTQPGLVSQTSIAKPDGIVQGVNLQTNAGLVGSNDLGEKGGVGAKAPSFNILMQWNVASRVKMINRFYQKVKSQTSQINQKYLTSFHYNLIGDKVYFAESESNGHLNQNKFVRTGVIAKMVTGMTYSFATLPVFSPNTRFITAWKLCYTTLLLIQMFLIPLQISFDVNFSSGNTALFLYYVPLFIYCSNILVRLNTGYYEMGIEQLSRTKVFQNYRFQSCLDFLVIIAFFLTNALQTPIFNLAFYLQLKMLIQLVQDIVEFYKIHQKWSIVYTLIKLLTLVLYIAHTCGCIFHLISQLEIANENQNTWLVFNSLDTESGSKRYLNSLYFSIITMITVGYGDIRPIADSEKMFIIFMTLLGSVVFAYVVNTIGSIFQELAQKEADFKAKKYDLSSFMMARQIKQEIQVKVMKFLDQVRIQEEDNPMRGEKLLGLVPKNLQEDIRKDFYGRILYSQKIFSSYFTPGFLSAVSIHFRERVLGPGELFYSQNSVGENEIFFIQKGVVEQFLDLGTSCKTLAILKVIHQFKTSCQYFYVQKHGDHFGFNGFFSGNPRMSSAKSITMSHVLVLPQERFIQTLKSFPQDFEVYYQLKELMTIQNLSENKECPSCGKFNHTLLDCHYLHFKRNRELLLARYTYSVPSQRSKDVTRKLQKSTSPLKENDQVRSCLRKLRVEVNDKLLNEKISEAEKLFHNLQQKKIMETSDKKFYAMLKPIKFEDGIYALINEEEEEYEIQPSMDDFYELSNMSSSNEVSIMDYLKDSQATYSTSSENQSSSSRSNLQVISESDEESPENRRRQSSACSISAKKSMPSPQLESFPPARRKASKSPVRTRNHKLRGSKTTCMEQDIEKDLSGRSDDSSPLPFNKERQTNSQSFPRLEVNFARNKKLSKKKSDIFKHKSKQEGMIKQTQLQNTGIEYHPEHLHQKSLSSSKRQRKSSENGTNSEKMRHQEGVSDSENSYSKEKSKSVYTNQNSSKCVTSQNQTSSPCNNLFLSVPSIPKRKTSVNGKKRAMKKRRLPPLTLSGLNRGESLPPDSPWDEGQGEDFTTSSILMIGINNNPNKTPETNALKAEKNVIQNLKIDLQTYEQTSESDSKDLYTLPSELLVDKKGIGPFQPSRSKQKHHTFSNIKANRGNDKGDLPHNKNKNSSNNYVIDTSQLEQSENRVALENRSEMKGKGLKNADPSLNPTLRRTSDVQNWLKQAPHQNIEQTLTHKQHSNLTEVVQPNSSSLKRMSIQQVGDKKSKFFSHGINEEETQMTLEGKQPLSSQITKNSIQKHGHKSIDNDKLPNQNQEFNQDQLLRKIQEILQQQQQKNPMEDNKNSGDARTRSGSKIISNNIDYNMLFLPDFDAMKEYEFYFKHNNASEVLRRFRDKQKRRRYLLHQLQQKRKLVTLFHIRSPSGSSRQIEMAKDTKDTKDAKDSV